MPRHPRCKRFSRRCSRSAFAERVLRVKAQAGWALRNRFGKRAEPGVLTMSQKSRHVIPGIVLVAATIFPMSQAWAQAPTLQEQLAALYKPVKMGSDTGGYSVVEKGTLLAIQKGGILGVPYSDKNVLATKYEGGTVRTPSGLMVQSKKALLGHFSQTQSQGQTTKLFAKGDKVYPTKIDVNLDKDTVTMGIVACDT